MRKRTTELVFIIDRSGSMHGLEADTIGGFNSMLEKQKNEEGHAYVSTVLFNDRSEVIHDRLNIKRVSPMTGRHYIPGGCTALLDAVGGAIKHIGNIHKYSRKSDVPEKTLFVIITDGMENASHKYSAAQIKEMINRQQKEYGWEFIFLGANIDAVAAADDIGISEDRAVKFCCDEAGTELNYKTIDRAVSSFRQCASLPADWKDDIEADERKRGRR